jgi:hypothetical protein
MSTCNRLDLQTLGSQPIMPKNLPEHCYTLPSNMHRILTQHGRCCMHNNQLPTKSLVELDNYSILSIKP